MSLALAIAAPGSNAAQYGRDGSNGEPVRWMPLEQAVIEGYPYFVEVASDILAVDADSQSETDDLLILRNDLRRQGYDSVLVASGQPGRCHLFVRMAPMACREWSASAKRRRLDVRTAIRPPLAPHRMGGHSELLDPLEVDDAIDVLGGPAENRQPPLSPVIIQLLREGPEPGQDRSTVCLRVARGFWRSGRSRHELQKALADPSNRLGEKYWEHSDPGRWLSSVWMAAQEPPPEREPSEDVEAFAARVRLLPLPGVVGQSRRLLLLGLAEIARCMGRLENLCVSQRLLMESCPLSRPTIAKHLPWATEQGWISLDSSARGGFAARYSLTIPKSSALSHDSDAPKDPSLSHEVDRGCDCGKEQIPSDHDAFRPGGLLKTSMEVLNVLGNEPQTTRELAALLGRGEKSVRKGLRELRDEGLARDEGARPVYWTRATGSLDEVAKERGTAGRGAAIEAQHLADRVTFGELLRRSGGPGS